MNLLYNTAIGAYALGARLASLRSPKVAKMLKGQREAVSHVESCRHNIAPDGFDVWFHVASLGEFEQARPLIEALRRKQPEKKILLTFFSPSGYEVRKNYPHVDCVAYLPFDTPARVCAFIEAAKPRKVVFVKYEFWGNYLMELKRRGIPVILIDAIFRPSQRFFKSYGGMFRRMLDCYSHIFVQDENSQKLLKSIGVTDVTVAGDTRFDRVAEVMDTQVDLPQLTSWLNGTPFTLIAGSSWPADEDCYLPWLNSHPEVKAIIAPHEFDGQRLQTLQSRIKAKSVLWTDVKESGGPINPAVQVVIIDAFGLLSSLYRFGSVAIIGGGFGAGIHNINEAAVYGMPVAFGPEHHKFKEAADLIRLGGAAEYHNSSDIAAILDRWCYDPEAIDDAGFAAGQYISSNLGATQRILPVLLFERRSPSLEVLMRTS
ncbi:MAG: glycosyltransferase N-terminal domain-containing protein [Bacteroidales bacterium]|nr:glycosyltransferase N-terminal domain-containing protein [Bacteroidales bacterium]